MRYSIRALQVFEALHRHGSFEKAAQELGISPSAISHQLKSLRFEIGDDLVARSGGTLAFTERGTRLARSLRYAFAHISESITGSGGSDGAPLRVAVCTAFGSGWLIPRISGYPNFRTARLQVRLTAEQPSLSDTTGDVFFSTTAIKEGYWNYKLFAENLVAVAAPGYETAAGPGEIALITAELDPDNFGGDWLGFAARVNRPDLIASPLYLGASHFLFAIQMAEQGLGIALVPHFLAAPSVTAGRLVQWSEHVMPSTRTYYMNVRYLRRHEPNIKDFTDWVRRTLVSEAR